MTQAIDLNKMEQNAYQDSIRGGIMEIVIGLFLLNRMVPLLL